ncbi:hypothetical protein V8G54_003738 [Vigna mungo]|uniref:Uncharacterized protein n=1 Tax=Vigna mungo TaxID=3915 RepID=A0AAQ3SAE8_VIGMU
MEFNTLERGTRELEKKRDSKGREKFVDKARKGGREELLHDIMKGKKESTRHQESQETPNGGDNSINGRRIEKRISVKRKVETKTNEVAKVVGFSGDSVVSLGEYVKTVKEGEDRGKMAKCGGNIVTISSGTKVKDEVVLSVDGLKVVVGVGTTNVFEVQNIIGTPKAWQQKSQILSWEDLVTPQLNIVEGNKRNMLFERLGVHPRIQDIGVSSKPNIRKPVGEYFLTKWQALCKKDNKQTPVINFWILEAESDCLLSIWFAKDYVVKVRSLQIQGLIQWLKGSLEAVAWEVVATIKVQFLNYNLEDKIVLRRAKIFDCFSLSVIALFTCEDMDLSWSQLAANSFNYLHHKK